MEQKVDPVLVAGAGPVGREAKASAGLKQSWVASKLLLRELTHPRWHNMVFHDLPDNAARISSGKDSGRYISCNDAPGANHGVRADVNTGENERSAAHPNVGSNIYRLTKFLLAS